VDSPYIFPTEEDLAKVKVFRTLTPQEETDYTGRFQAVLGV
jgi:spermidine/putrescine transport system substrate-binding protein